MKSLNNLKMAIVLTSSSWPPGRFSSLVVDGIGCGNRKKKNMRKSEVHLWAPKVTNKTRCNPTTLYSLHLLIIFSSPGKILPRKEFKLHTMET